MLHKREMENLYIFPLILQKDTLFDHLYNLTEDFLSFFYFESILIKSRFLFYEKIFIYLLKEIINNLIDRNGQAILQLFYV